MRGNPLSTEFESPQGSIRSTGNRATAASDLLTLPFTISAKHGRCGGWQMECCKWRVKEPTKRLSTRCTRTRLRFIFRPGLASCASPSSRSCDGGRTPGH